MGKTRSRACFAAVLTLACAACANVEPDGWNEASVEPYSADRLRGALTRVESWLVSENPVAESSLRPGLDVASIDSLAANTGCALPRELIDLYRWHDGMRADTDLPFTLYHRLLSLQDAVDRRSTYGNPVFAFSAPLPDDWLPVLEFQGEFYFVRCDGESDMGAPVWFWSGEDPSIQRVFPSITALVETAAEWYESGAIRTADTARGLLDMDIRRVRDIFTRRNPDMIFPYYVDDR